MVRKRSPTWIRMALLLLISTLTACDIAPTAMPASGTATEITKTINGAQYTGLAEWARLAKDPRLELPLFATYTSAEQWRPIARQAAKRGVALRVAHLDPNTGGEFRGSWDGGEIVINDLVMGEPIDVQGYVIAHEVFHASHTTPSGAVGCLEEEAQAFAWGALAYASIVRTDPREDDWTRGAERVVDLWKQGRTREVVLLHDGYQRECLGGVVR